MSAGKEMRMTRLFNPIFKKNGEVNESREIWGISLRYKNQVKDVVTDPLKT